MLDLDRKFRSKELFKLREEQARESVVELIATFKGLANASEIEPRVRDSRPDLLRCHLLVALSTCSCPREKATQIALATEREHVDKIESLDDPRELEALKDCLYLVISTGAYKRNMPLDSMSKKSLAPFVNALDAMCALERAIILSPLVNVSSEMLVFGAMQRVDSRLTALTPPEPVKKKRNKRKKASEEEE